MSEPTLCAALMCDKAFMDVSGKFNLIGIFSQVNGIVPCLQRADLYLLIADMPPKGSMRFDLKSERGEINWTSGPIAIESPKAGTMEGVHQFQGLPFHEYGTHRLEVSVSGQYLGCVRINVAKREANQQRAGV